MTLLRPFLLWLLTCLLAFGGALAEARDDRADKRENLPAISINALPEQARDTLHLIALGGPFPFRRDGIEFQNREHRLPAQMRGYYREYTVPTPGAGDRGARRIIAGQQRDYYYTADHYRSFQRIQP